MTDTDQAIAPVDEDRRRKLALLKAVGLDKLAPEQRELALHIAQRYDLDLLLKHLVMIEGRPYITRDGLLHVAHRSGQLDGIETSEPAVVDGFWRVSASVYRKDMSRPFTYFGRYPTTGGNQKFAPEMATKVAEVMALRRAFDVAAPVFEERWDAEVTAPEPAPPRTLAQRVAQRVEEAKAPALMAEPMTEAESAADRFLGDTRFAGVCGEHDDGLDTGPCEQPVDHLGPHRNAGGVWPSGRRAAE